MSRLLHRVAWVILLLAVIRSTRGQEGDQPLSGPAASARILVGANQVALSNVPSALLRGLHQQDVFNELTDSLLQNIYERGSTNSVLLQFLMDLHLRPKLFQATGGGSNDTGLGFEFDYRKALAHHVLNPESLHPLGLSLNLDAKGDVAVDAAKNPNNFMEGGGSFHLFQGLGGIAPRYAATPEAVKAQQRILQMSLFEDARSGNVLSAPAVDEFTRYMRPQFFYDLAAHGKIETDQEFDNRQWVYGAQLGLVFREWRMDSRIAWFNLFDYPFALLRAALKKGAGFRPSGRTFPSVIVGYDQVDPSANDARLAIDRDEDPYERLRLEVAFKTPIYQWKEDNLYVSASYRHFRELSASSAIEEARLDRASYFVVLLDLPYHFNVSYSTGRLPLDQKNDQVYAAGWMLNF